MTLDLNLLLRIHDHGSLHGIPYVWGAKPCAQAPSPEDTAAITGSDCSGWWQYLMRRLGVDWPEGSVEQRAHVAASGYRWMYYGAQARNSLSIAFIEPVPGAHAGHVWGVVNGETIECYGGHGVGSRPWNTGVLIREVSACYLIQ